MRHAGGWFVASAEGGLVLPLDPDERRMLREITAENLVSIGIREDDGVVAALNSDGAGVGVVWSEAASLVAHRSCAIGVRGGTRLSSILESLGATVLVSTPSFVRNLGVRTRQIGSDPREFGLRSIVLTGEIVADQQIRSIEEMFDARVAEVWSDPIFGAALAHRGPDDPVFSPVRPALVSTAPVSSVDEPRGSGSRVEWVVDPVWCRALEGVRIRTGFVGVDDVALPTPTNTIGDHVLVRGRWLSHSHLTAVLAGMGVDRWQLEIGAGLGSDVATLRFEGDHRERDVRAATDLVSAVRIEVLPVPTGSIGSSGRILDHRGQHLGLRA